MNTTLLDDLSSMYSASPTIWSPPLNTTALDGWSNATEYDQSYSTTSVVSIVLFGAILSILTGGMNLMVMISFNIDQQLQTISNYFLFSLAVADVAIGFISIPLMTVYTAQGTWNLGYNMCQLWLCIDYLMSNASVLNLLLISFDRYFSVTRPLTYRPKRTTNKAAIMIAATYVVSLILWPPWIVAWPYIEGTFAVPSDQCMVQFLKTNAAVTVGTAMAAFYLPVSIMIILYARVYWETQKRQKAFKKMQAFGQTTTKRNGAISTNAGSTMNMAPHSQVSPFLQKFKLRTRSATDSYLKSTTTKHLSITDDTPLCTTNTRPLTVGNSALQSEENGTKNIPAVQEMCKRSYMNTTPLQKIYALLAFRSKRESGSIDRISSTNDSDAKYDYEDPAFNDDAEDTNSVCCPLRDISIVNVHTAVRDKHKKLSFRRSESQQDQTTESTELTPMLHSQKSSLEIQGPNVPMYTVLIEMDDQMKDKMFSSRPSVRIYESQSSSCDHLRSSQYGSASNNLPKVIDHLSPLAKNKLQRQRSRSDASELSDNQLTHLGAVFVNDAAITPDIRRRLGSELSRGDRPASCLSIGPRSPSSRSLLRNKFKSVTTGPFVTGIQAINTKKKRKNEEKKRTAAERRQESKAAKTLSAILFAFILTWTPYNLIVCIECFWPNTVPVIWWTISYYLCYINSTVNPLCYALCNANFRQTYVRILTCKWKTRRHQRQEAAAQLSTGYLKRTRIVSDL